MLLTVGATYGPYRVIRRLTPGGMGEVAIAEDIRLPRSVVLKCLSGSWLESPLARQRLLREARTAAALNHRNIATLYDVLDDHEHPLLVMEYVEGRTLHEILKEGAVPIGLALRYAIQITEAVWLTVSAMLVSVSPAQADFWDWLQEFSGPGPFGTGKTLNTMLPCPERLGTPSEDLWIFDASRPLTCFYIDHRSFDNSHQPDNFGTGKVSLHIFDFGVTRRIHPAVDVGFGMGLMTIDSNEHQDHKWLMTAPRVVFTPAMLFKSYDFWNQRQSSRNVERVKKALKSVKYYGKLNVIVGEMDGADFGVSPDAFQTNWERVWSAGFIFDANEIIRLFKEW
jgi:serine/threonine protein kinase